MQYLKSINIKKIRHLKNLNISMDSNEIKHLIITGKNGSGKTSILEAINSTLLLPLTYSSNFIFKNDTLVLEFDKNILDLKNDFIKGYLKDYRKLNLAISNGPNKNLVNDENDDRTYLFVQYLVNMKTDGLFAKQDGNIQESDKINSWFRLFESFLKKIFEDEHLVLKFDYKKYDFIIELTDKKSFNIRNASAGYSAVLKIVAEIMFLMELDRLNYDKPGIVMIDELETHLHVTLQKIVLPMLISFFPNIQFIITTHSPFIINSCKNCIVYDLEKQIQVEDLSAYSYESIIENYFDVDKYSNEIKDKIERYELLIKKDTLNEKEVSEKNDLKFYIEGLIGEELVLKIKELKITQKIKESRKKLINITKTNSNTIQKLLDKEKSKYNGVYNLPEVVEELKNDFYNKCYLCEQKNTSANIEHFIPHKGDNSKKFNLKNLYFVCNHCNQIKGVLTDILDVANKNDDVESIISYYMDVFPKSNIVIESTNENPNNKIKKTVDLLTNIYYGNTALKKSNAENIKVKLQEEIRKFYDQLVNYFEHSDEEVKEKALIKIKDQLHPKSEFCIFKHWLIKKT